MKLSKEVFENIYCSGKRPLWCYYETNMCCMFCKEKKECFIKNKQLNSPILPCINEELQDDENENCDLLI